MIKIGYARVSTFEQNLDLQLDALKKEGCKQIFTDKISGVKSQKPNFEKLLAYAREGDTIVVWKLDRLGRSTVQLIEFVVVQTKSRKKTKRNLEFIFLI